MRTVTPRIITLPSVPSLLLTALVTTVGASLVAGDAAQEGIEDRFRDPPRDCRILQIIHNLPADPDRLESLLDRFDRQGFGGLVVNVHFDGYLRSRERWEQFRAGVRATRARGMTLWLYDEAGYPSAAAGGITLESHPEWEAQGLHCVLADSTGGEPLEWELPEGQVVHLAAYPVRDGRAVLTEGVELEPRDGKVRWDRPGRWRICALVTTRLFKGTHAEGNLYRKRPYPNLLDPRPTRRFIEVTHEAYARELPGLSESFEAVFTDEPSLMSVYLKEQPWPALPWSPDFRERFREARGYDIGPRLPGLFADFGPEGRQTRCDFWSLVGREVADGYFGQIRSWCRQHGIASTGHLLAEEDLGSHVGFYGDFYACASLLDYPGIDCLTSDPSTVPWHVAKLLGSVACVHNRPRVQSETSDHMQRYRPPGDARPRIQVTTEQILGTLHLLHAAGVNTTTSYYSWAGLDDEEVRSVNEQVGRAASILVGSKHVADIAVVYPLESLWSAFVPQRSWATGPEVADIDHVYRDVLDSLFHGRRDFDIVDSSVLESATVEDGALHVNHERYRLVVLPATDVLPLQATRKLSALVSAGGSVVAVGARPENTPGEFPSDEARSLLEGIFGSRRGVGIELPAGLAWLLSDLADRLIEPDLSTTAHSPLRYRHVRQREEEFYFLLNHSSLPLSTHVRLRAEGTARLWDCATGAVSALEPDTDSSGATWPVKLPAHGAAFISIPHSRKPVLRRGWAGFDSLLERVPLEVAHPGTVRVEGRGPSHVSIRLVPEARSGDRPALPLRIDAEIPVGGKDSWCFAEIAFDPPLDISDFRAVEIVTRVPVEQKDCGTGLLSMLVEGSSDYLANARRPLARKGTFRSCLPLDAFRLAGWSKDPDGRLDRREVDAMRIGWGGYTPQDGERVSFEILEIHLVRLR